MTIPLTNSVLLKCKKQIPLTDNFITPQGEPLPADFETLNRQELKRRLTIYIIELLETNFEKLCNMIYRHDVSEKKFNQALNSGSIELQAENIAELVMERELQKVKTRQMYRREKEEKMKKGQKNSE